MSVSSQHEIVSAVQFSITDECQSFITDQVKEQSTEIHVIHAEESETELDSEQWMKVDQIVLFKSDKQALVSKNDWLNDNHMTCAQLLLKHQFPHIGGLKPIIEMKTRSVKPLPPQSLQILHTCGNHWVAASTMKTENEDISLYDCKHSTVGTTTKVLLAQLVHTDKPTFSVKLSSVSKQSGSSDCGLYAVAYITHIAFGDDPSLVIFNQSKMREHLLKCLEEQQMQPFPIMKKLRTSGSPSRVIEVQVCCYCRCPDDGSKMVACDGECGNWFHVKCINTTVHRNKKWYCKICS